MGFIPMNRNACNDEKVRYELGEGGAPPEASDRLKLLEEDYLKYARELDNLGFNSEVLDLKIPVYAPNAKAPEDMQELAEKMVDQKALSKAGRCFKLGQHVITAPVVRLAAQIQRDREKQRVEAKEKKTAAKNDSTEMDAIVAFGSWNGNKRYKIIGRDIGQPDMDKQQMRIILAYLLKKGSVDETISSHDKNRATIWDRLQQFGRDDGQRNWVGQMQHFSDKFYETSSTQRLLQLPPLFPVDDSAVSDPSGGDKDVNEQAAM